MRMAQRSPDYWKKRFKQLEEDQYRRGAAYYQDIQNQFRKASNQMQMDIERWYQRLADNNEISLAGAKKLLKKNELEEFHWTVEQYIKAGKERELDGRWVKELENASARHHISRLEAMKLQARQHAELLSAEYEGGMADFLHKSYSENYYKSAFEVARGTGVGSNLARLDTRRIDAVVRKPWAQDGANFSDRIWSNKQKLVNNLHTELTQSIIRGAPPKEAIDRLAKTMNVSKAQAGRLVMTESAAIAAAAERECFQDLGVKKYQILAALDSSTCDICQELDGKVFNQRDFEVGVTASPFHPNCRCTEIPYFEDEFTAGNERAARGSDGKTNYVPADMKYPEWKKQFVVLEEDRMLGSIKKKMKGKLVGSEMIPYDNLPEKIKEPFNQGLGKSEKNTAALLRHEISKTDFYISDTVSSEYMQGINAIGISTDAAPSTLAHELFHKIDAKNNITKGSSMIKNFIADYDKIGDVSGLLQNQFPEAFELTSRGHRRLKEEYRGISDIISALSKGTVKLGYGHSEKYWNKQDGIQMQEIWAQYGRIYYDNNPKVISMLETLFPSGTQRVNIKLRRLVEDVEG